MWLNVFCVRLTLVSVLCWNYVKITCWYRIMLKRSQRNTCVFRIYYYCVTSLTGNEPHICTTDMQYIFVAAHIRRSRLEEACNRKHNSVTEVHLIFSTIMWSIISKVSSSPLPPKLIMIMVKKTFNSITVYNN